MLLRQHAVAFDPATQGFAFPNAFVNVVLTLPNGTTITTAGRCGGMAYAALDYFLAGQPVPRWGPDLWAPGRVPPDGHWLADYVTTRLRDSFFTGSAAKFLIWSIQPDDAVWVLKGVSRWTKEEELPRLMASIDKGRPVVLGLVVARSLSAVGDNHQVLAYGYERTDEGTTVHVYDNNSPGRDVTLTSTNDQPDWKASNGPTWRGFFVQDYTPRLPRVLTRRPPDRAAAVSTGATLKLSHGWTGRTLHSHRDVYPDGNQQVTCFSGSDDNDRWQVVGDQAGVALRDGSVVRLRHLATGRWLHSAAGVKSPVTHQQEISAVDDESLDTWRVEIEGTDRPWTAGARVRLIHVPTGAALHSHPVVLASGQQEVTAFAGRDGNDWWTVLELS